MKYEEFMQKLDAAPIAPIYIFYGEEDRLAQNCLKHVKKKIIGDDPVAGYTEFDGEEVDVARLFDLLRTPQLFGEGGRNLVVIYQAQKFIGKKIKLLEKYADSPSKSGSLVLMIDEWDYRKASNKKLLKLGIDVDCRRRQPHELPGLVRRMAVQAGKKLDPAAAKLLIEFVGNDLGQLRSQIENLAFMAGESESITEDDVMELVGSDFQRDIWDLVAAVGERKADRALLTLERLMRQGEAQAEAPGIIAALAYELRELAGARRRLDEGMPPGQVLNAMSGPRPVRERRLREAKNAGRAEIARRTKLLSRADLDSKTGAFPVRFALERMILGLCQSGR